MTLIGWLLIYAFTLYWGASYFTEQDGTRHQTVVRDTDFTPSHILEFYLSYPIYIIAGWGAFMCERTRIPCSPRTLRSLSHCSSPGRS